jgi:hypothetical protein
MAAPLEEELLHAPGRTIMAETSADGSTAQAATAQAEPGKGKKLVTTRSYMEDDFVVGQSTLEPHDSIALNSQAASGSTETSCGLHISIDFNRGWNPPWAKVRCHFDAICILNNLWKSGC